MNKVFLTGHVGQVNELGETKTGRKIIGFTLASVERYTDSEGRKQKHTDWHDIVAHGKLAEIVSKHVKKGNLLCIEGKLSKKVHEKDGKKTTYVNIVLDEMEFLSKKNDADKNTPSAPAPGDTCPKCKTGKLILKNGRNGDFLACDQYPACKSTLEYKKP